MKSVEPSELITHRAFFTEFDKYNSFHHWENSRKPVYHLLQRKLKLLILTKGHVVVAASQLLESPFAHDLLIKNPSLLNSGAIVSSMKYGHDTSLDFLTDKREEQQSDTANPYHSQEAKDVADLIDSSGTIVRWSHKGNSSWFRDRLAGDLDDPKSLIRSVFRHKNIIPPRDLAEQLVSHEFLSRGKVESMVMDYGSVELSDIIIPYSNFIYYLSGARTLKCEGVLPQENLVDFSISDLINNNSKLSEHEVFFKIFIDTVKAKTSKVFPSDFLDSITIDDALELRGIAIEKNFTEKYNLIQSKTKEALEVQDPERLVLLMSELEAFESELYVEFSKSLDKELPTRIKEKKQRATGSMVKNIASLLMPVSPQDAKELLTSTLTIAGKEETAKNIDARVTKGLKAFETILENMNILERQVLLDFVDELKKKYSSNML